MQSIKWSPLNHIVWVNLEMSPQKFDGFRLQRQRRPFMSCDGFRQGKGSGMGSDKDDHSRPLMSSSERICADENTCGHVFPVLSVRSTSWWEKTWEHQPRERCTHCHPSNWFAAAPLLTSTATPTFFTIRFDVISWVDLNEKL